MAKLYPPYIEGTIPACAGTVLTVPFSMNKAVGKNEVNGFILKLKTVQNSIFIDNIPHLSYTLDPIGEAMFDLSSQQLKVGQYYKVQLAYVDADGITGHFSTVGVFKYTAEPTLSIESLDLATANKHRGSYIGTYNQKNLDITEKAYSYQFRLYSSEWELLEDSGELLHNSSKDTSVYESYDEYSFRTELEENLSYYISYSVTTLNGLVASTPKYRIIQAKSIPAEIKASLTAELNFDNGYVALNLIGARDEDTDIEYLAAGSFMVSRKSDEKDAVWEELLRFSLQAETPSRLLLKDCTVRQGVNYTYSMQQYNDNGLYSDRILSNEIYADFEDAFLFDGTRQLKIKYNPKVSSFKNTILESKIDTIGSKHPFIFRNGNVNYKEFPISGLISYYMDEEEMFMEKVIDEKTIDLTGENIAAERDFKLEVLEWLTNGEPKLFRSPSEGNYIVRLMNTSLTPTDTVGRMLHTFSCIAYEIDEFNYDNLGKYDILHIKELDTTRLRWATTELRDAIPDTVNPGMSVPLTAFPAETVSFVDMIPGDIVYLDGNSYMIGATGGYNLTSASGFNDVRVSINNSRQGSITYSYYSEASSVYELINDVSIRDVAAEQYIGKTLNIIDSIENIRDTIIEIFSLQFKKRPIYYAFYKDNNANILYEDNHCTKRITENNADVFALYDVRNATDTINGQLPAPEKLNSEYYIDRQFDLYYPRPANPYYYDGKLFGKVAGKIPIAQYDCSFQINGNKISLLETEYFDTDNMKDVESIILGNGVWLEMAYQLRQVDYHMQFDDEYKSKAIYEEYLKWRKSYNNLVASIDDVSDEGLSTFLENFASQRAAYAQYIDTYYNSFVATLESEITQYKEDNGIVW